MKLRIVIDETRDEEIIAYVHKESNFTQKLSELVENESPRFTAYRENEGVVITPQEVYCFVSEQGRVYALTQKEKLLMKTRLYKLEEMLGADFVKINQSCIGNITKIKSFDTSISGTLRVKFKNGYTDYVSRRQIKTIKGRLGV